MVNVPPPEIVLPPPSKEFVAVTLLSEVNVMLVRATHDMEEVPVMENPVAKSVLVGTIKIGLVEVPVHVGAFERVIVTLFGI